MPPGYAAYPGPHEAEEGETYTYLTPGDESVAATVEEIVEDDDGSIIVSMTYGGGQS